MWKVSVTHTCSPSRLEKIIMPNSKNNNHDKGSKGSMGELFTGFRRRLSSLISEPTSSPVKAREFSSYIEKASEIEGVKTSTDAMKACGMQPELASVRHEAHYY